MAPQGLYGGGDPLGLEAGLAAQGTVAAAERGSRRGAARHAAGQGVPPGAGGELALRRGAGRRGVPASERPLVGLKLIS